MAEVHDFEPVIVLRGGQQDQERLRGRESRGDGQPPLQLSTSHPYIPNHINTPNSAAFHTPAWLTPHCGSAYNGYETRNQWSPDGLSTLETTPYEGISPVMKNIYTPYSNASAYYSPPPDPPLHSVNQLATDYPPYYPQAHSFPHHSPHDQLPLHGTPSYSPLTNYEPTFNSELHQNELPVWSVHMPQNQPLEYDVPAGLSPDTPSSNSQIHWPTEPQMSPQSLGLSTFPVSPTKRKRASPDPAPPKRSRANDPQKSLSEFVVVFENAPGALSTVKHRRKLDAPVRKAARDVRKAGACHQCRFRKRTVSSLSSLCLMIANDANSAPLEPLVCPA